MTRKERRRMLAQCEKEIEKDERTIDAARLRVRRTRKKKRRILCDQIHAAELRKRRNARRIKRMIDAMSVESQKRFPQHYDADDLEYFQEMYALASKPLHKGLKDYLERARRRLYGAQ